MNISLSALLQEIKLLEEDKSTLLTKTPGTGKKRHITMASVVCLISK